jgi:hypothetical protein
MGYRLLVLKEDQRMTPRVLSKIRSLVKAGATVVGPRPVASPSLADYPNCDREVRALADEVWSEVDGTRVKERRFGRGRVVWGTPIGEVLASMDIGPDVEIVRRDGDHPIEWIHRRTGDADAYFLSNQKNIIDHGSSYEIWERRYDSYHGNELEKDTARVEVAFRVTGRQPELWNPVTGTRRDLLEFCFENGRTIVPLSLPPSGSCFVVFRRTTSGRGKRSGGGNISVLEKAALIGGPWTVAFDPTWGGPASVTFETLDDWIARPEPGIRYYSGRATYRATFAAAAELRAPGMRVHLDLGSVRSLAEVRLNGNDLGVIRCPPWRVEVTGMLEPTRNVLEIDVVNLWANRIIGDMDLPLEKRLSWTSMTETISALKAGSRLVPSGLRGPVTLCLEKPFGNAAP